MKAGCSPSRPVSRRGAVAGEGRIREWECAFCNGTGRDPFGLISPLACCQVCGGTGRMSLYEPVASCAFCRGTGIHPGSRLTCTACGGVGTVGVPQPAICCPQCQGTGRAAAAVRSPWPDSPLPCSLCGGRGFVAERIRHAAESDKRIPARSRSSA